MKMLICAPILALALAAPAFAQDFTGPRAEVHGGWDHVGVKLTDDLSGEGNKEGVVYGVGVGYDMPVGGSFIAGVEGGFDMSTVKRCGEVFGGDRGCAKVKRDWEVGARLGSVINPTTMFYVKGGYANGKASVSYDDGAGFTFSGSDSQGGIRGGAGVEMSFGRAYAKVEYRYTDYKTLRLTDGVNTVGISVDRHQVVGGLGVRF